MNLEFNVFDVWVFQRNGAEPRFLLLHTSEEKARRYFNGGRFWQIPSHFVKDGEAVEDAIARLLSDFGLAPTRIWAGEHAYTIYNRRFRSMQIIGVYAAEVSDQAVRLDAAEHSESVWLPYDACLDRVHYRGLKDGLRSVQEYITSQANPAPELCLYTAPGV
jgi:ADP-ribose pyrophosphatase YjhB (NUDIX family)